MFSPLVVIPSHCTESSNLSLSAMRFRRIAWQCASIFFSTSFFPTSDRSPQAPSRHMKRLAYRCFLPDLTGFTRLHCARPKRCGPTWKRDKKMAESERFELSVRYQRTHDFQSCSFNHSDNSPQCSTKEAILLSVATPALQHEPLYQSNPFLSIGESKFFQEATGDFERAFFVMLSVKLAIGLHLW